MPSKPINNPSNVAANCREMLQIYSAFKLERRLLNIEYIVVYNHMTPVLNH